MWNSSVIYILALVSMATEAFCQSGEGDWGSGLDIYPAITAINDTKQTAGDEPARDTGTPITEFPTSPSPAFLYQHHQDKCSLHFKTNKASARWLKAEREELMHLQAIQYGNKAVMENLVQFVGAELVEQSYEDVIKENILGIQEDHKRCHEVLEKVEKDLKKQLEGEVLGSLSGIQKGSYALAIWFQGKDGGQGNLTLTSVEMDGDKRRTPTERALLQMFHTA